MEMRFGWRNLGQSIRGIDARIVDGALVVALSVAAELQISSQRPGEIGPALGVLGTTLPLLIRRRYPIAGNFAQIAASFVVAQTPVMASTIAIFLMMYSIGA